MELLTGFVDSFLPSPAEGCLLTIVRYAFLCQSCRAAHLLVAVKDVSRRKMSWQEAALIPGITAFVILFR